MFLAAVFSGIMVIFPYFIPFSLPYPAVLFFDYVIVPFWVVKIAFSIKNWKEYLKTATLYWAMNFLIGGMFQFLYNRFPAVKENSYPMLTFFGTILFACMFMGKGIEIIKNNFLEKRIYLPVIIRIGEKSIKAVGLMDTGNQLKEPISKKPVVIVEKELLEKEEITLPENNFYAIPFHSLGKKRGIMRGFIAEEIIMENEQEKKVVKQVMIGICEEKLSMKGEYSLILNPML